MERLANSGARISMVDPRVTSVQTWILGTIGISIVGLAGWGIKSINDLNQTMTRVVTQNEYRDADMAGLKDHIKSVDQRVVTLEQKAR